MVPLNDLGWFALATLAMALLAAAFGLTALLLAVPLAFGVIKAIGAAYLLWLAWQALKPGGSGPFQTRSLPAHSTGTLLRMGFLTNLLNPKVALFTLSFFPQFLHPENGSVLLQALQLGAVQITASAAVNTMMIFGAASITGLLSRSQAWMRAQRYVMGSVLAFLALRVALIERK